MGRLASSKQLFIPAAAVLLAILDVGNLAANDYGLVVSGSWSVATNWSDGVVPGMGDNAFVGSTTPSGALSTATVSLTQDVSAGNLYLGHDNGTSGTLALGDFTFTGKSLFFGFVGTGSITRGTGHIDVTTFDIRNSNSFTLASTDVIHNILNVSSGSSFTLSANLAISDKLDIKDSGTVLNAAGHDITATNQILLGWDGVGAALQNRGKLTTNQLLLRGQTFQLTSTDAVGRFTIDAGATNLGAGVVINRLDLSTNSTATTVETGNITNYVNVASGSTLTLGANLTLTDKLDILNSGTVLDAAGHNITATNEILLGWDGVGASLQNRGTLTTNQLSLRGQTFQLTSTDAVGRFTIDAGATNLGAGVVINRLDLSTNSTATTAETGNITAFVLVDSGSTLTLGANLTLSDTLNIRASGTVLDAAGHNISATNQVLIGWDAVGATIQNRGTLSTANLLVKGQNFQLTSADAIANFTLDSGTTNLGSGVVVQRLTLQNTATGTTAETGNITTGLTLKTGSSLTLGANLSISDNLNVSGSGTVLNANGHDITTTRQFLFGWDGSGEPTLQNLRTLNAAELLQSNGAQLTLG
ncbi:MAG TPA: hypothetical protein VLM40_11955, partial [Gemmata sp.]|nr:hypothetical protein [Gemmata sp.]